MYILTYFINFLKFFQVFLLILNNFYSIDISPIFFIYRKIEVGYIHKN